MENDAIKTPSRLARAQGCLLGQLAGDALGSLVEFMSPGEIAHHYPNRVTQLADGGSWNTLAGQPTDDSEMALMLARMLVRIGVYDPVEAKKGYLFWLQSMPFDCGNTVRVGLEGEVNPHSQANGALMRISPLGIFGVGHDLGKVMAWAEMDAHLTHPHPVCVAANALFTAALTLAIEEEYGGQRLYQWIHDQARRMGVDSALMAAINQAASSPPGDFMTHQGWVLIAFQNALWQLLHAPTLEQGVVDTVMRGGDTDTNAAICGALLGAVHGVEAIPRQWREKVLSCRPETGRPGVRHPRPQCFWPVDALELAERLLGG